ncbi:MAG: hypothetical protein ABGZ23_28830 [Fuerstiella sp.]
MSLASVLCYEKDAPDPSRRLGETVTHLDQLALPSPPPFQLSRASPLLPDPERE